MMNGIGNRVATNKDEEGTTADRLIKHEEIITEDALKHRQELHAQIGDINIIPALRQATPKTVTKKIQHSNIPYWKRRKCNKRLRSVDMLGENQQSTQKRPAHRRQRQQETIQQWHQKGVPHAFMEMMLTLAMRMHQMKGLVNHTTSVQGT